MGTERTHRDTTEKESGYKAGTHSRLDLLSFTLMVQTSCSFTRVAERTHRDTTEEESAYRTGTR